MAEKCPSASMLREKQLRRALRELEGSSDHHAERHEMTAALAALKSLGEQALDWQ
jgi:hypothetical protein